MARVAAGLELLAMVGAGGGSWGLAPLYRAERPVHVSAVALCDARGVRERARARWCARGGARVVVRARWCARGAWARAWWCARGAWVRAVSNVGDGSVSENDVFIYKVMP